ncbi:MAG: DUF4249 domain-containing protein [Chitinophagaceae bacterium]|jgi:hypothetical protein|nr:DUF4249 domain-containing protein [Chitinophagaceae bacterium]
MKKKLFNILPLCLIVVLLSTLVSCEKELVLNLPASPSQLVVEGEIENGQLPQVLLTNSLGFFDKINLSNIKFEKGATITVTDLNTNYSVNLIQFGFPIPNATDSIYFYTLPPLSIFDSIKGQIGHRYKLQILNKGILHEAITSIPNQQLPDSMWAEKIPNDSGSNIRVKYQDPDTLGNYTKYKTQVLRQFKNVNLSEDYLTSFSSTFNDALTNGQTLPFTINLGYNKNINFNDTSQRKYFEMQTKVYKGDTVNIKFMGIDYATYQFWETLEYSKNSTGNPFASPTKVQGNVSNAIGIWGGYGSKLMSIILPK